MSRTERKKPDNAPTSLKWLLWGLLLCAAGGVVYFFPPFRIVPLDAAKRERESATFDPKAFAEEFWNEKLMRSLDRAVEASTLLAAIEEDVKAARDRYARTWGIGSDYYYFIAGTGSVVSVDADFVSVCVAGNGSAIDISIATGNIFGNAIRNGTGLIDASARPNSQDLNNISLEINRIVETQVLPPFLERVGAGSRVRFVGCAEIADEDTDLRPMRIIPVVLEVE
jgi:predicted lipoprotein